MPKPSPILSALFLLLPAVSPAEPLALHEWDARPADPRPALFRIPHGSAAILRARLPAAPESATFLWQTNGMASLWWEAPVECSSNAVSVLWTPEMDSGAGEYRSFFRITQTEGPDYSAFATLAMLDSPGFAPNALPTPVERLDFATVSYTNAPWVTRSELRDATNALVIAAVDLAPYATWQGLDAATNALWRGVRSDLDVLPRYDEAGGLRAARLLVPWGMAGVAAFAGDSIAFHHPAVHGGGGFDAVLMLPVADGRLATEDYADNHIGEAIAEATNGLLSAETELEAIRAAADGIELPEDPTAAELGAAFRDLLLCIRNPVQARAALRARTVPSQESNR